MLAGAPGAWPPTAPDELEDEPGVGWNPSPAAVGSEPATSPGSTTPGAVLGFGRGVDGFGAAFGTLFKPFLDGVQELFLAVEAGPGAAAIGVAPVPPDGVGGVEAFAFAGAFGSGLGRVAFFFGVSLTEASS